MTTKKGDPMMFATLDDLEEVLDSDLTREERQAMQARLQRMRAEEDPAPGG